MSDIKISDVKLKSWVIDSHEMFYRDDILDNPNPLKDDMVAFYHCEKDMYQVKRNSVYGQILFKMINNGPTQINTHDTLVAQNLALKAALETLLNASVDYVEYKHDGDPDNEDARVMGEMELNDLDSDGSIEKFKKLLEGVGDE